MKRSAHISECGKYRYSLARWWDDDLPIVAFVMLNPSTADALIDDPTIRRCIGFAKAWGCGRVEIYNLFALRSTDPKALRETFDPVGPANDDILRGIAACCVRTIAAWGSHGKLWNRGPKVAAMFGGRLEALAVNADGTPKHPLYVKGDAQPVPYR